MSSGEYAQELIKEYPRLEVENYCIIASTVLLWFDFSLTFTDEVRRIWRRKFTGATLVYLCTRYIALVERIFFAAQVLLWKSSDQTCGRLSHTDDILTILNFLALSAFTILRVYGVWGRDWTPILIIAPLTLIRPALAIIEALPSSYRPFQGGPPWGCLYHEKLSDKMLANCGISTASKATTFASDAILVVLTWIKTFSINRESMRLGVRTPLATLLLRDGTAYFLVLLVIQIITIITTHIGSSLTVWVVWAYFEQVLTVIFLSRFMLDLRGLYFAERPTHDTTTLTGHGFSDIHFHTTSNIVGNLGATLEHPERPSFPSAESTALGGRDRREDTEVETEWYEDEVPEYTSDPFKVGLMQKAAPRSDLGLAVTVPHAAEVELGEIKEPTSPGDSISQV